MSWAITVNDMNDTTEIPEETLEDNRRENWRYPDDIRAALFLAKRIGLKSTTLSGARTPNPYNGNEVIVVTITGVEAGRLNETMREAVQVSKPNEWDEQRHERSPES